MKHIVSKTAFKTVLAVLILLIIAFGVMSFGFPQYMATFFEDMGNYSLATSYASLAYTYDGKEENLVRCVDDSILSGNDKKIVDFASRLVNSKTFDDYCAKRDEITRKKLEQSGLQISTDYSYKQYVMGNLACSQYSLGDGNAALETAVIAMDGVGFPANNVLVMLSRRAIMQNDTEMKQKLYEIISNLTYVRADEEEYRRAVLQILT